MSIPTPWAIAYFVMIPMFAVAYSAISGDFYHANLSREPVIRETASQLAKELQEQVIQEYFARNSKPYFQVEDRWYVVRATTVSRLWIGDDGNLRFVLMLRAGHPSETVRHQLEQGLDRSFDVSPVCDCLFAVTQTDFALQGQPVDGYRYLLMNSNAEDTFPAHQIAFRKLFPFKPPNDSSYFVLRITEALYDKFQSFRLNHFGWSITIERNFERYLYLSAVTATTVGYGDIVPLTTRARMAVAAEAVCGIALAGMFLNALASKASRSADIDSAA
jgi:hypothetical protein